MNTSRRNILIGSAALLAARGGSPAAARRSSRASRASLASPDVEAFLQAVRRGDLEAVRAGLQRDAALASATDAEGRSAIALACLGRHEPVVDALVAAGGEIGFVEAVMVPDWERAEELARADPSLVERWFPIGGTALYASARAGETEFYNLQVWGADADGNPRGRHGVTPAYGALECPARADAIRTSVALLSNGAHVNAPQRGGDSLLHLAARRGDAYLVRYLLRRGADVGARDRRGRSALDLARQLEHADVVALLEHPERVPRDVTFTRYAFDASGSPVEWPELDDIPPEVRASSTGPAHFDFDGIRAIVDTEPRRAFCRSSQNELVIEAPAHIGHRPIMRYLLDHGVPQATTTSISVGDLERARALLRAYPEAIHERGAHDFPLFWYAAIGGGSVEAAELLLEHGADVDQESQLTTALHLAAQRNHLDLARWLVEHDADIDRVGYKFSRAGDTPLALARQRGNDEMARLLEDLGAS